MSFSKVSSDQPTNPAGAAFFVWYVFYVLVATFYSDAMATPLLGMNVGIWLGILQFVTTFLITALYIRFANREIDPAAERIRTELEGADA